MNAPKREALAEYHKEEPIKRKYTAPVMIAVIQQAQDASTKEWSEFTTKQYECWWHRPGPTSGMVCIHFGA